VSRPVGLRLDEYLGIVVHSNSLKTKARLSSQALLAKNTTLTTLLESPLS